MTVIDYEYQVWKGEVGPGALLKDMIRQENEQRMAKVKIQPVEISKIQIEADVIAMIKAGQWVEDTLTGQPAFSMPMTKDRKLYEKTAKVLTALGGKWNRKAQATLFVDEDAEVAVRQACETGAYVDLKKAYQFFETPDNVAQILVNQLEMTEGKLSVLEPSAGRGALIRALAKADNSDFPDLEVNVTAIELNPDMEKQLLEMMGPHCVLDRLVMGDFLSYSPDGPEGLGYFDRIVMNPPFTKSQDIKHVQHAYNFLKPGGTMVAVMSPGFTYRSDNTAELFRMWLDSRRSLDRYYGHCELPEGSFKVSGTNVRTVYLVIQKGK